MRPPRVVRRIPTVKSRCPGWRDSCSNRGAGIGMCSGYVCPCARSCALAARLGERFHGFCVGRPAALDPVGWGIPSPHSPRVTVRSGGRSPPPGPSRKPGAGPLGRRLTSRPKVSTGLYGTEFGRKSTGDDFTPPHTGSRLGGHTGGLPGPRRRSARALRTGVPPGRFARPCRRHSAASAPPLTASLHGASVPLSGPANSPSVLVRLANCPYTGPLHHLSRAAVMAAWSAQQLGDGRAIR